VEEGGSKDALPLLAFTLERLYREQGTDGDLKLVEYEELGRVKGSIEVAVDRALKAADADPNIPRDPKVRLELLRRGLIPWLADIDPDTGAPRRSIANRSKIPAKSLPLIDLLVDQRLLSTDTAKGEKTIEPAHEALLRQWGLLRGWLSEDRLLLETLESIKRAARKWKETGKVSTSVAHLGESLKTAERLYKRPDLAAKLDADDEDYLGSCRQIQREINRRPAKTAILAVFTVAALSLAGFYVISKVYQDCYRFDPTTGIQSKVLGPRICQPGKLVFLKYTYPSEPDDEPNRVLQVSDSTERDINGVEHARWTEQYLTGLVGGQQSWSTESHHWVTVVDNIGGTVLRRVDLELALVKGVPSVLEFFIPKSVTSQLSKETYPGMRWAPFNCSLEWQGGPSFTSTEWPVAMAVADPTFWEWVQSFWR
jgi:hypothetical protein